MSTPPPPPPSRSQRQERTRHALVTAAGTAFAREGFHGASLEAIAAEAGYTKGAVYSNFANKAELYLAVMDRQIDEGVQGRGSAIDAFEAEAREPAREPSATPGAEGEYPGHLLASLEFLATALRDPGLAAQLEDRLARLRQAFVGIAEQSRAPGDPLGAEELGSLLLAFQQGSSLLKGLGTPHLTAEVLEEAMQRIATPRPPGSRGA